MDILQACTEVVVMMMMSDMGSQHVLGFRSRLMWWCVFRVFQDEQHGLDWAQLHTFSCCLAFNKTHLSSISHLVRISRLLLFNSTVLQNRKTAIPKWQQTGHKKRYPVFLVYLLYFVQIVRQLLSAYERMNSFLTLCFHHSVPCRPTPASSWPSSCLRSWCVMTGSPCRPDAVR